MGPLHAQHLPRRRRRRDRNGQASACRAAPRARGARAARASPEPSPSAPTNVLVRWIGRWSPPPMRLTVRSRSMSRQCSIVRLPPGAPAGTDHLAVANARRDELRTVVGLRRRRTCGRRSSIRAVKRHGRCQTRPDRARSGSPGRRAERSHGRRQRDRASCLGASSNLMPRSP